MVGDAMHITLTNAVVRVRADVLVVLVVFGRISDRPDIGWDVRGEGIGADVYLYQIKSGDNVKKGKLVIVR